MSKCAKNYLVQFHVRRSSAQRLQDISTLIVRWASSSSSSSPSPSLSSSLSSNSSTSSAFIWRRRAFILMGTLWNLKLRQKQYRLWRSSISHRDNNVLTTYGSRPQRTLCHPGHKLQIHYTLWVCPLWFSEENTVARSKWVSTGIGIWCENSSLTWNQLMYKIRTWTVQLLVRLWYTHTSAVLQ